MRTAVQNHASLRILFIEDHADLAANLCDYFEERGHSVDAAMDGITGLHLALVNTYDVIVLDLMLPGMDGITLCRKLRQEGAKETPVLILSARSALDDKVAGFNNGADDYLSKPFELKELEMRVQALAKRASGQMTRRILQVADLEFNQETMQIRRGGRRLELPTIPMRILELLMGRSPAVVWRRDIEQTIWGDSPPDSDALRVHMHTLRSIVDGAGQPTLLHTLRGVGYRLGLPDAPPP
ncbi:MAG: response regulator transcription factor [Magnetococcales bacterium]|nr:response regulator transcription factor [Magnetococcales bacterium]MBF0116698.1 response regulator transcription factor [Magnetococcales bacterium]